MNHVATLDPLGADEACRALPAMNAAGDLGALHEALVRLLPGEPALGPMTADGARAAMRDLGLFAGSIKRHGVDPADAVRGLEPVLLELGRRSEMAPRDTVFHYGPWNPRGPRQRMYTGDSREGVLIESVRVAAPALARAALALAETRERSPLDPQFAAGCARAAAELDVLVGAVDRVRRELPAHFFARSLRPYFEEITVRGKAYAGPAAAHLPLYLVDHAVWTSDRPDAEYRAFQAEAVVHGTPEIRALFQRHEGRPSLTTLVLRALAVEGPRVSQTARVSAAGVEQLLVRLVAFRGKHLVLARREYDEAVRLYPVGSAGASVDLVARILELTRSCRALLGAAADRRTEHAAPRAAPAPEVDRPRGEP